MRYRPPRTGCAEWFAALDYIGSDRCATGPSPERGVVIPDEEVMLEVAKGVEAASGDEWDEPSLLATVFRRRVDDVMGMFVYPFAIQPYEIDDDPAQGLLYLAGRLLTDDNVPPLLPGDDMAKGFAGVLFKGEGWMRAEVDDEARGALGDRRFADIPGSKEVRFVHLVDCGGRYYTVNRPRGEKPETLVIKPGRELEVLGNVPIGLRDLLLAFGRQLPFGTMDLDALRGIGAERLEEPFDMGR